MKMTFLHHVVCGSFGITLYLHAATFHVEVYYQLIALVEIFVQALCRSFAGRSGRRAHLLRDITMIRSWCRSIKVARYRSVPPCQRAQLVMQSCVPGLGRGKQRVPAGGEIRWDGWGGTSSCSSSTR